MCVFLWQKQWFPFLFEQQNTVGIFLGLLQTNSRSGGAWSSCTGREENLPLDLCEMYEWPIWLSKQRLTILRKGPERERERGRERESCEDIPTFWPKKNPRNITAKDYWTPKPMLGDICLICHQEWGKNDHWKNLLRQLISFCCWRKRLKSLRFMNSGVPRKHQFHFLAEICETHLLCCLGPVWSGTNW